jgi:hypothetical protein
VLSAIHDRSQLHMHVGDISRTKASRPSTEKGPCQPFAWAFSVTPSVRQEQSAAKRHGSFPGGDVCDAAAVRTVSSLPGQNSRLTRLTTVGWLTALSRSQLQSRIDVTANRIVPFAARAQELLEGEELDSNLLRESRRSWSHPVVDGAYPAVRTWNALPLGQNFDYTAAERRRLTRQAGPAVSRSGSYSILSPPSASARSLTRRSMSATR